MKKWTRILKVIVFSGLFLSIFLYLNQVVSFKQLTKPWDMTHKVRGLTNEPPYTMDVMYFGSSHMYSSINPVLVWEEIGVPSYSFATRQQPLWITYHYMKEALKYQKPKVMVLDLLMTKQQEDYSEEGVNRTAIDLLPMSLNRLQMIQASVKEEERWSYYINFIKYHSRWKELKEEDWDFGWMEKTDPLKGYVMLDKITPIKDREDITSVTEKKPLSEKTEKYLLKIIELCKKEGINLVFYKAPSNATQEEKAYFNTVEAIAKENNIPFIDYNEYYDILGLDIENDFYDKGHVNYIGSEKVTKHFAQFLKEHFELEDKRNDKAYANWNEAVTYYNGEKEQRPLTLIKE